MGLQLFNEKNILKKGITINHKRQNDALHPAYYRWICTVSVFLHFCFSVKKYAIFHPHFYTSISALTRQSHTGQEFSEKMFLQKGTALF